MKKHIKFLSVAIGLLLAASVAGCGNTDSGSASSSSSTVASSSASSSASADKQDKAASTDSVKQISKLDDTMIDSKITVKAKVIKPKEKDERFTVRLQDPDTGDTIRGSIKKDESKPKNMENIEKLKKIADTGKVVTLSGKLTLNKKNEMRLRISKVEE